MPNEMFALTAGDLSHTTGLHIPVDAGVAAALLRLAIGSSRLYEDGSVLAATS